MQEVPLPQVQEGLHDRVYGGMVVLEAIHSEEPLRPRFVLSAINPREVSGMTTVVLKVEGSAMRRAVRNLIAHCYEESDYFDNNGKGSTAEAVDKIRVELERALEAEEKRVKDKSELTYPTAVTCDTPGCGRPIPKGGGGHPEICPICLECLKFHGQKTRQAESQAVVPLPLRLHCPGCGDLHVDEGEFATKPHHTHACQMCGEVWRPALVPTVGVRFLPGFKNA